MADTVKQVDIVHSLYLDLPMLLSFLATLEDGVAYANEVSDTVQRTRNSGLEVGTDGKLPDVTSLLGLSLNLSGKLQRSSEASQTVESRVVRQHTAASLFNSLRNRLYAATSVQKIRSASDLARISTGSIVELSGAISESPLQRIIDFARNIFPFAEMSTEMELAKIPRVKRNRRDQLSPEERAVVEAAEQIMQAAKEAAEANKKTLQWLDLIEKDLKASPVVDFAIQGDNVAGFLAASREFLADDFSASIMGGTFKALGKVTAINSADDARAPVVRRGAMGALPEDIIETMLQDIQGSVGEGIRLDLPEGQLRGPYLQMIPLAIFI